MSITNNTNNPGNLPPGLPQSSTDINLNYNNFSLNVDLIDHIEDLFNKHKLEIPDFLAREDLTSTTHRNNALITDVLREDIVEAAPVFHNVNITRYQSENIFCYINESYKEMGLSGGNTQLSNIKTGKRQSLPKKNLKQIRTSMLNAVVKTTRDLEDWQGLFPPARIKKFFATLAPAGLANEKLDESSAVTKEPNPLQKTQRLAPVSNHPISNRPLQKPFQVLPLVNKNTNPNIDLTDHFDNAYKSRLRKFLAEEDEKAPDSSWGRNHIPITPPLKSDIVTIARASYEKIMSIPGSASADDTYRGIGLSGGSQQLSNINRDVTRSIPRLDLNNLRTTALNDSVNTKEDLAKWPGLFPSARIEKFFATLAPAGLADEEPDERSTVTVTEKPGNEGSKKEKRNRENLEKDTPPSSDPALNLSKKTNKKPKTNDRMSIASLLNPPMSIAFLLNPPKQD